MLVGGHDLSLCFGKSIGLGGLLLLLQIHCLLWCLWIGAACRDLRIRGSLHIANFLWSLWWRTGDCNLRLLRCHCVLCLSGGCQLLSLLSLLGCIDCLSLLLAILRLLRVDLLLLRRICLSLCLRQGLLFGRHLLLSHCLGLLLVGGGCRLGGCRLPSGGIVAGLRRRAYLVHCDQALLLLLLLLELGLD